MPRSRRSGLPGGEKLPGTLRRSSKEAQETFTKAHDTAVQAHAGSLDGALDGRLKAQMGSPGCAS